MLRHLPNLITALRLVLVVPLCHLIATGRYESALLVTAIAGFSDALDGYLAKRFGWTTWIGGMLDPIADKLMLMAAFVSLAFAGVLPIWMAVLVVGRDLAIVVGAIAYHNLVGRFDAEPSRISKLTTVVQIVFVLAELLRLSQWIEVPAPLHQAMIGVVALLTLASGVHYIGVWGARARHEVALRRKSKA
ncbi:MAG: CDP-alcohol phosphatidyltransferase family protein [Dokdonella sp.]|uniref:CDP-alcohol phosphatidyltransferase family protein n=1 Tax=Dokdonella sp. TaxID=2291710 RepID=UPI003263DD9A